MAAPKKKVSISKVKKRYHCNFSKIVKCRKMNYSFLDLMQFLIKNENWMPVDFIKHKKNKYQIKK